MNSKHEGSVLCTECKKTVQSARKEQSALHAHIHHTLDKNISVNYKTRTYMCVCVYVCVCVCLSGK